MLDALWLRIVGSLAFGYTFDARSLDGLVAILRATRQEFGALEPAAAQALEGPVLDESTRRAIQLRRFRQAARAARETDYYGALFERLSRGWSTDAMPPIRQRRSPHGLTASRSQRVRSRSRGAAGSDSSTWPRRA